MIIVCPFICKSMYVLINSTVDSRAQTIQTRNPMYMYMYTNKSSTSQGLYNIHAGQVLDQHLDSRPGSVHHAKQEQ